MKRDSSKFTVMDLNKEFLKEVSQLAIKVFMEFEAPNEPEEGIKNFIEFVEEKSLIEKYENKTMKFVGGFCEDKLVGLIAIRDGSHISLLFVAKEFQKRGIAKELLKNIVSKCKKEYEYLTVNSSIYAADIYHKFGFINKSDEQLENGIRFIPMQLSLKDIIKNE